MANFVCFLAARAAQGGWDVREAAAFAPGLDSLASTPRPKPTRGSRRPRTCSASAPTPSAGFPPTTDQRMDVGALCSGRSMADRPVGDRPFLVVGTAGTVSTGAVDPLAEMRRVLPRSGRLVPRRRRVRRRCGAGPRMRPTICARSREADSVAVDPHKWLYAPLEAGCVLVRACRSSARRVLVSPAYYHFDEEVTELLRLRSAELARFPGAEGVAGAAAGGAARATLRMIADDMRLAQASARARAAASGVRGDDAASQHHDVPLRAARPAAQSLGAPGDRDRI